LGRGWGRAIKRCFHPLFERRGEERREERSFYEKSGFSSLIKVGLCHLFINDIKKLLERREAKR
jgi:hypothetical protein